MKYLQSESLSAISSMLNVDLPNYMPEHSCLRTKIEAYSLKKTRNDKRMAEHLGKMMNENNMEIDELSNDSQTDRLDNNSILIDFITLLSASYPDYYFEDIKASQFTRITSKELNFQLTSTFEEMFGARQRGDELVSKMFDSINEALSEEFYSGNIEIYSYIPDPEGGPFTGSGIFWSVNYVLLSKKLKRMIFLSILCSKGTLSNSQ